MLMDELRKVIVFCLLLIEFFLSIVSLKYN